MSTEFDRGIAVSARPSAPASYDAELGAGWQIGAGVNGGMLLATLGNALGATFAGDRRARRPGLDQRLLPLRVPARAGRGHHRGAAQRPQHVDRHGVPRCRTTTPAAPWSGSGRSRRTATSAGLPDDVRTTATPPDLPPPDRCVSAADAPPSFMEQAGLLERLDLRLDPAYVGWAVGKPSGTGRIQGWLRMADPREPDPLLLLLAVDALPPVTFDLGLLGWTPTLELTVHLRAMPAPGWLRVVASTRNLAGGFLEEDAEVWDSADRLVAQSRQLARAPR